MRTTLAASALCLFGGCLSPNDFDRAVARRDLEAPAAGGTMDPASELLVRARDLGARASLTLDAATLEEARVALAQAAEIEPGDGWVEYHAAQLAYVRMTRDLYAPDAKDRDAQFERDVASAVVHAEAALESGVDESECAALLAAIQGQRISQNSWLGMQLGPESDELLERALRANPENPRALLVQGISLHFTPALFGGDEERALASLQHAIELFQREPTPSAPRPCWGHAEAHAWCGQVLCALGRNEEALAHYERALEIAPAYGWVAYDLLPSLQRKRAKLTP